jgi:DNA polymerase-1
MNMQNIPAKESVGNRYRNCFIAPEGWSFVDSDYSSQELCVIAFLSKDPVWIKALERGEDLHSVCAELVYGKKWKDGAEPDCAYYHKSKQKCKCKKHKTMRTGVKTINFGLAYGMSAFKLARTLHIPLKEAKALIEDYFKAFPKIKVMLDFLGRYAVSHGFSRTMAPFFRKRWYPYWESAMEHIEAHIREIEYNPVLGSIERAGKNAPIQG